MPGLPVLGDAARDCGAGVLAEGGSAAVGELMKKSWWETTLGGLIGSDAIPRQPSQGARCTPSERRL
jgi:hypothetical protein